MARKPDRFGSPVSKGVAQGRVDMGVDYSGTGNILAVQDGVVTYIGYERGSGSAGGNGPFMIYKTASGRYVYVAEQWTPGVKVGQRIKKGQRIGTIGGGHIEVGFAAGPTGNWNTSAKAGSGYTEGQATTYGRDFARAVAGAPLPDVGSGGAAPSPDATTSVPTDPNAPDPNAPAPPLTIPDYQGPGSPPSPYDTVSQAYAPGTLGASGQVTPIDPVQAWHTLASDPAADPLTQQYAQQVLTAGGAG